MENFIFCSVPLKLFSSILSFKKKKIQAGRFRLFKEQNVKNLFLSDLRIRKQSCYVIIQSRVPGTLTMMS